MITLYCELICWWQCGYFNKTQQINLSVNMSVNNSSHLLEESIQICLDLHRGDTTPCDKSTCQILSSGGTCEVTIWPFLLLD